MSRTWAAVLGVVVASMLYACVNSGPGSDFDDDGVVDKIEDPNDNFEFDPGETDFLSPDSDLDGVCDGQPDQELPTCAGCEDCNGNGFWEPCLGETDPLNNDTDNDGVADKDDLAPLDRLTIDCSQGDARLPYGGSLPSGKPFPLRPTPTPSPTPSLTSTPEAVPLSTPTP